jgi:YjbE family integral membrane protein
MPEADTASFLTALFSIVVLNIVLSGDNAIVVAMAAAGLPRAKQRQVIMAGIGIAFACRVVFSLVAVKLLKIVGLLLVGGFLLLWVAWKMWRDLRGQHGAESDLAATAEGAPENSVLAAILQITVADVSMSLDNVLAVAGAARDNFPVLVFGLLLSIGLMGLAAGIIARLLERWRWLSYLGLMFILYIALQMIWDGGFNVVAAVQEKS